MKSGQKEAGVIRGIKRTSMQIKSGRKSDIVVRCYYGENGVKSGVAAALGVEIVCLGRVRLHTMALTRSVHCTRAGSAVNQ